MAGNKAEVYLTLQTVADAVRALPEDVKILTVDVSGVKDSVEGRIHVWADSEEEAEKIVAPQKPVFWQEEYSETVNEVVKRWNVPRYRGENVEVYGVLFVKRGEDKNAEES